MDNLLNKNNYLVTCAQEISSKNVATLKMLPFSSRSSWLVDVQTLVRVKWRIITFKSYLETNQIAFPCPTKISTTYNDLNWKSNIIISILWTWFEFFLNGNWKKGWSTFTTLFCIFFGRREVLNQMGLELLSHLELETF